MRRRVLLKDGTLVPADLIVVCTGYTLSALVERALGQNVAERIGQIWGEDEDGELSNMFKRTRQPGTWFIAGSLSQAVFTRSTLLCRLEPWKKA